MARLLSLLSALALACVVLAGCAAGPGRDVGATGADVFTRAVTVSLDSDHPPRLVSPNDVLAVARTTFTYTEPDGGFQVAGVQVAFTNSKGQPVLAPLSHFTAKTTLARGDQAFVPDVLLTSGITFTRDGTVVAQRSGLDAQWLHVEGVPVPLAAADGGHAHYTYRMEGSAGLTFDAASFSDPDGEGFGFPAHDGASPAGQSQSGGNDSAPAANASRSMRDFRLDGGYLVEGTGDLRAQGPANAQALTLQTDLTASGHLDVTAELASRDGTGSAGAKLSSSAAVGATVTLLASDHQVTQATTSSHAQADAHVFVRAPGEAQYTDVMKDARHPLLNATDGPDTTKVDVRPAAAILTDVLKAVYGLTLVPGDSFHFGVENAPQGFGLKLSYDILVASRQQHDVAGSSRLALKLQGTTASSLVLGGRAQEAKAQSFTYFVDAQSMLPLALDAESVQTYSASDLRAAFAAIEQRAPGLSLPHAANLELKSTQSITLDSESPGLQVAAVTQVGTLAFPLLFFGAGQSAASLAAFGTMGSV